MILRSPRGFATKSRKQLVVLAKLLQLLEFSWCFNGLCTVNSLVASVTIGPTLYQSLVYIYFYTCPCDILFLNLTFQNKMYQKISSYISPFLNGSFRLCNSLEKISSSCGGLQPSAAMVGPFGPNNRALWAHIKMLEMNLKFFIWKSIFKMFPKYF